MDKKIQDFFPDDKFDEIEKLFTRNRNNNDTQPNKERCKQATSEIKQEGYSVKKKEQAMNVNSELKQKSNNRRRMRLPLNKTEGFLMFAITLLIVCVVFACVQVNNTNMRNILVDEIGSLETQIKVLQTQIDTLETKLELYITDENKKPINITLDINGIEKDYIYDTETGETTENGNNDATTPQDPTHDEEFDTRPFLGVAFMENNDDTDNSVGLKVDYVYQYSPAEFAGMKAGDILISINGNNISTRNDLDAVMSMLTAEDTVELQFITTTEGGTVDIITVSQKLTYRGNFELPDE